MNNLLRVAMEAVRTVPEVVQYLSADTKDALKSYDYFLSNIEGLVRGLYSGNVGGEFIDTFANLISGQLLDAYEKAWFDEGFTEALPDYLQESYQAAVSNQYGFVDQFYRDIVDAQIDKTSIEPLMVRAQLWANQWKASYNEAVRLIALENGARLRWNLGEAEHCNTCLALDGIVAFAKEWDAIGIKPQSDRLECHGFNCKCSFVQTDKRRSRDAYGRIEAAIYETKSMKGGEGSGNFGHAGRPGEVGGSAAGGGGSGLANRLDGTIDKLSNNYIGTRPDIQFEHVETNPEHLQHAMGHGTTGNIWISDTLTDAEIQAARDYDNKSKERAETKKEELENYLYNNGEMNGQTLADAGLGKEEIDRLYIRLDNYNEIINRPFSNNALSVDDVITHEFGHHIAGELGSLGISTNLTGRMLDEIAAESGALISEYATTSGGEYFAEAYISFVRGEYDKINPDVLNIFIQTRK